MGITIDNVEDWINKAKSELDEYWVQHYFVLLHFVAIKKIFDNQVANTVYQQLNDKWKKLIEEPKIVEKSFTPTLFGNQTNKIINIEDNTLQKEIVLIDDFCKMNNQSHGGIISLNEYMNLKSILLSGKAIAARGGKLISEEKISQTLNKIREN